jgi:glutathione synthase/RimK-type ligase-like ATP-grasp enzyme
LKPQVPAAMIDCTLVTCENVPALDPDDRLLLDELRNRGLSVSIGVWSDPAVHWRASRLCVLRSTWDYHRRHREFLAWLESAARVTTVRNDPSLLRWNSHKSYLRDLERCGVRVVPTAWIARGSKRNLSELARRNHWSDLVMKPAHGAAAHDVRLVRANAAALASGQAHLDRMTQYQDVLVQPYLDAVVGYGERALIFIAGRYSHAVVKKPFDNVLAIGDAQSLRVEADAVEIATAAKALGAVPGRPLYARVDLLRDDSQNVCVSEVELIEPALYLGVDASARRVFADAIEGEFGRTVVP